MASRSSGIFSRRRLFSPAQLLLAAALCGGLVALGLALGQAAPAAETMPASSGGEAPFLAENEAAMNRMMSGMAVAPTGDVDRDFVAMMAAHHQGAIDMAETLLRYGHNEQLRRIAQEIIVDQQQEIAAMRLAVGEPLPPSAAAPTQPSTAPAMTMSPQDGAMSHIVIPLE
ncbi:DUF305 domain-containing protein [Hypericibacter sp.]|uniref:DUF305 domain-containing protein n=1 Tax=Hypericibacter sp. TaxID=2705401 RepID=UPI003D6C9FFD